MMTIEMNFHCYQCDDGTIHVQNTVMGRMGQHHVHTSESFEKWKKGVKPGTKFIDVFRLIEKCDCGLEGPGWVREYDGRVWFNDRFINTTEEEAE